MLFNGAAAKRSVRDFVVLAPHKGKPQEAVLITVFDEFVGVNQSEAFGAHRTHFYKKLSVGAAAGRGLAAFLDAKRSKGVCEVSRKQRFESLQLRARVSVRHEADEAIKTELSLNFLEAVHTAIAENVHADGVTGGRQGRMGLEHAQLISIDESLEQTSFNLIECGVSSGQFSVCLPTPARVGAIASSIV